MKVHDCAQNTPEWLLLRAGIPTASAFEKIVTPKGALSKQARDYKAFLLAERVMRAPITQFTSADMIRGTEFEQAAADFYAMYADREIEKIGFITTDDGTIGASPDRWAGVDGQLEIKVPSAANHMGYYIAMRRAESLRSRLLDLPNTPTQHAEWKAAQEELTKEVLPCCIDREYWVQVQGQLWISERGWSDVLSFSPENLPPVISHVLPDKDFIEILAKSVTEFSRSLEEESARLVREGIIQEL